MTTSERFTGRKARRTEFLTNEEALHLIGATTNEHDRLLLRTLWETGGRVTEVTLMRPDLIMSDHIILPNLKQKERIVPLKRVFLFPESTLIADLREYCERNRIKESDWVFPGRRSSSKPLSRVYIWRLVTRLAKELSIRHIKVYASEFTNRPAWPHLFRHSAGVLTLRRTGRLDVVRDQLGHSSVKSTEVYAVLTDEDRKRIVTGVTEGG